jgi:DNA-binding beta-propeller fold protein YncE
MTCWLLGGALVAGAQAAHRLRRSRIAFSAAPFGLGFDASGNLFVTNFLGAITEYAPPLSSGSLPALTISGLSDPQGVVVDPYGNLFVANAGGPSVQEYAPPYTGSPVLTLTGVLSSPDGVALLLK